MRRTTELKYVTISQLYKGSPGGFCIKSLGFSSQ
jgi:hypothetical protein